MKDLSRNVKLYCNICGFYKILGKVYVKGLKSNGMLIKLDTNKIINLGKDQMKLLYNALGVKNN